jgi:hypothetical protein
MSFNEIIKCLLKFQQVVVAVCFEIGKRVDLEKNFQLKYKFQNFKDHEKFVRFSNFQVNIVTQEANIEIKMGVDSPLMV